MASAPLYDYSVVPFTRSIKNLVAIFDKAEQYAKENGDNVDDYIKLQIHPDMKEYASNITSSFYSTQHGYGMVRVCT